MCNTPSAHQQQAVHNPTSALHSPKLALILEAAAVNSVAPLPHVAVEASALVAMLLHAGWDVKRLTNAQPEHLREAMRTEPQLLIVLAHTDVTVHESPEATIGFNDDTGMFHVIEQDTLMTMLTGCKDSLELVMLAGCKSDKLAMKLANAGLRQIQCWKTLVLDIGRDPNAHKLLSFFWR